MSVRIIAVVVGIEQYSDPAHAPPLRTPCADALRVAVRLQQAMGVEAGDTYVFLQPSELTSAEPAAVDALKAALKPGTRVTGSCTHQRLDAFWRVELRALQAAEEARLVLFWSGHGFTDARGGLPYLLCADWSNALATRTINRLDLLETLHSTFYFNLRSQLILVDACATAMVPAGTPATTEATWTDTIDQVCVSSAARGQYAYADDHASRFTSSLLTVLDRYQAWPDLDDFSAALRDELKRSGYPSSLVRYRRGQGDEDVWRRANPARDQLVALLKGLDLAPPKYRPLYSWVVSGLSSQPDRGAATTIDQMIDDLWNANGSAAAATAPYPVVEFALRLRETFAQAEALDAWIFCKAFVSPADLAQARDALKDKDSALFLVVDLKESRSADSPGEIVRFRTHLLRFDHVRSAAWASADVDVQSWPDLAAKLSVEIQQAHEIAVAADVRLTLEFVTNVYDIDPHRITIADGVVGELRPVVLRSRTPRSRDARQPWLDRAEAIRQGRIEALVHRIRVSEPALADCRVLFVEHALAPGSHPPHPAPMPPEWQLLRRVIAAGVPFICWPLCEGKGGAAAYEEKLTQWVQESTPLDKMPGRVLEARIAGGLAAEVNVFWDDPLPTWQLRECFIG